MKYLSFNIYNVHFESQKNINFSPEILFFEKQVKIYVFFTNWSLLSIKFSINF